MRLLSTLLVCSFSISALSVNAFAYVPLNKLPDGSSTSLILKSLSDDSSELNSNSDDFYPPASTLKLVTALAAKLELGDDFHYTTSIALSGSDSIISFSGDPTLQREQLKGLLAQYTKSQSRTIKGNLYLDNTAYTGYQRAVGWPWDILGVCYSAPSSAMTLDSNCAQASIYTKDNGGTRVYIPAHYPIDVTTTAATVTRSGQKATQCDLELITTSNNAYKLSGCLVERKKPLPLKFAIQNPELYTSQVVHSLLKELKIQVKGDVIVGKKEKADKTTLVASHNSEKLPELLDIMLKKSDNLIADNLTKTLGATFYVQPGSFNNGTEAIKQILLTKANIDLSKAQLVDGSGLSRNNRMSSQTMAQVLRYIWENDQKLNLIEVMPTSGVSGTLKHRPSMRKAPVQGNIIAKSGSLYGSYNMAGYGLDESGKPNSLFIQFVRDYFPEKPDPDKPVEAPITQFERAFYKDVVEFSQTQSKSK
ncbi:serine-type D-Ala-D-Ala carboxypeptidase [Vibrio sp. 10N.261.46.E12]|uniref:serine-type D-Ala-D-Ala carboxypeptidase n=1 Tax=unclassified Vibrio TaxID=2614977 RepID=UPI0009784E1B|nr:MULTISPECIES: serine-type D-Ala-D-Ala carboxypeptidase [unclassified Vibrio]OMO34945.1 serine-type D-Ala-D-Ala carboxypeptidase [Vibrio sp. 10N.261.45.E1]PMJ28208.1 serine-type D-Ala-D-Ala carboxypeptidase [Vibrio sp. 10N.286.45.B6]PML88530.1 serine-type D-Ala-D-Ala carboxypeptidase [Vibrio sp. 10N.261.49.E11]PMM78362.1 serine-type D-Ala-D-Ala carboxypeptidase [Vibrio sp. 10N.261.46.F12]PMM91158.1 serine-type D-Ala-D-Ala carboxypeptidase [Vibrio sp. 10N.261.46.E8]